MNATLSPSIRLRSKWKLKGMVNCKDVHVIVTMGDGTNKVWEFASRGGACDK